MCIVDCEICKKKFQKLTKISLYSVTHCVYYTDNSDNLCIVSVSISDFRVLDVVNNAQINL